MLGISLAYVSIGVQRIVAAFDLPSVLMIAAAVLALVRPRGSTIWSRLARAFALVVLSLALLSSVFVIVEHAAGREVLIEAILLPSIDREAGVGAHIAILLALSYGLLSAALLLRFRTRPPESDIAEFLAVIAALTAMLIVFAEFENFGLNAAPNGQRVLVTALTAMLLAAGVLVSRRGGRLSRIVAEHPITARLVRPLLVVTAITPIATTHLSELAAHLHLWRPETAAALATLACTIILLAMTIIIARTVARTEGERESAAGLLRLQIARMPVACFLRDASLVIQSWNPAAEKIFGYTEAEMLGRTTDILLREEDTERIEAIRCRVLAGEANSNSVVTNIGRDGQAITCRWSNTPLLDANGKVLAVMSMVEDLTAEGRATRRLSESETRYRLLIEHSPDGILVRRGEHIVFANRSATTILGMERPDYPFPLLQVIHPEDVPRVLRRIEASDVFRQPAPMADYRLIRPDGATIEIETSAMPIVWDGAPASQIIFRDVTERNASRRKLKLSEERYRRVVESTNEGLLILNEEGLVEFANEQICRMVGRKQAEVVGQEGMAVIATAETLDDLHARRSRRKYGVAERYETVLQRRSGEKFHAFISAAPLFADDVFIGSVALISDISDRKEAEQRVRESEARYRDLLDSMPNYIFSIDRQNRYTAVNEAVCRMFGRTAEEVIGRTPLELGVPTEAAQRWDVLHEQVLRTGEPLEHETSFTLQDGRRMVTRALLSPIRDDGGEIAGISGIALDITDQKKAESDVQRLLRAIEQIDEVMFTTDLDGRITYANPAFERLYGYDRDEVIGQTAAILKSGAQSADLYARLWRDIRSGRVFRDELFNKARDGSIVRVIVSIAPVLDDSGHITGFIAVQRDVTAERLADEERRRVGERLARLAKMEALGTLAGGIAHDFNNILAIVMSHTSVLERRRDDRERFSTAAATIKQAVRRGAALSKQILTFARRTEVKMEPVDAGAIIIELSSMISETFPRNIHINLDLDADLPRITGDGGQIHQALLNLCVNARDAMPSGGILTITARNASGDSLRSLLPDRPPMDHVCISVADNGVGMDEATRSRIFEPFFTTKEKGKGTGLGLALVYGVVNSHRGTIDVKSSPGNGTEFRLYLPVGAPPQVLPEAHRMSNQAKMTGTVLAVDDEPAILGAIAEALRADGCRVLTASDANEALALCEAYGGGLDLIVTDLGLPGLSTSELLPALRQRAPRVPIFAMTGYVDLQGHETVAAAKVKIVLQKPFDMDELLMRVRETLNAPPAAETIM